MPNNIQKALLTISIMLISCFSFWGVRFYIAKHYFNHKNPPTSGKRFINGIWYFFDAKGCLQTGIYENNNKRYYSTTEGAMTANEWITINNKKYYIKADSSLAAGNIIINGKMESFNGLGEYIGSGEMINNLFVKFLNVGSADCAYIKLPNGEAALIDTGDVYTSRKLVSFLKEQNLKFKNGKPLIDYVIITHPHSDHIGGLIAVLDNFKVKKLYMIKLADTKDWYCNINLAKESIDMINLLKLDYDMYKDTMDYINKNKIEITNPVKGEFIDKNNILQFIQSDTDFKESPISGANLAGYWNDKSLIIYLSYEDLQVLFTGDIQSRAEKDFIINNLLNDSKIDVLKVPHHGYDSSSTLDFLKYVKPEFGVISNSKEFLNLNILENENINSNSAYNNLISTGVSIYQTGEKDGVSIYATKENWNLEN